MHNKQTNKSQASICYNKHNFYNLTTAFCDSVLLQFNPEGGWAPHSPSLTPRLPSGMGEKIKKKKKKK